MTKARKPVNPKPGPTPARAPRKPPAPKPVAAPAKNGNSKQARIVAILGSTGSGKTHTLKTMIAASKTSTARTLIWSPKEAADRYIDMFPGSVLVRTVQDVEALFLKAGRGPVHIVFAPTLDRKKDEPRFSSVCKACIHANNVIVIVDEIHTVVRPSWAPDGWSQLVLTGRAYGIEAYAMSQRPTGMDKNFYGNCSEVHTGRLAYKPDCQAVAPALGVDYEDVQALTGFQWIRRNILSGEITRG